MEAHGNTPDHSANCDTVGSFEPGTVNFSQWLMWKISTPFNPDGEGYISVS